MIAFTRDSPGPIIRRKWGDLVFYVVYVTFEQGDEMLLKRVGVVHCPSKWIVKNWNARDAFCSSRSTTLQSIMSGETGLTAGIP